jgi:sec-independent protein translocase protein TatA
MNGCTIKMTRVTFRRKENPMRLGASELGIILVIVVLLFGVGRISSVAKELGSGIRAFREGLSGESETKKPEPPVESETGKEPKE